MALLASGCMFQQAFFLIEAATVVSLCLLVLVVVSRCLGLSKWVSRLLIGAFVLRAGTAVVIDSLGTFAGQFDFFKFDAAMWKGAQLLRDGTITAPLEVAAMNGGNEMYIPYTALYSPIYAVFGHHTLLARIAFALIGTLFVLNVYRLTEFLSSKQAGLWAAGISAVFPYWLYLSAIFYRDMLIMLVLSQVLYALLRFEQSKSPWAALNIIGLTFISFMLRPQNILPIGAAAGVIGYAVVREVRPTVRVAVLGIIGIIIAKVLSTIQVHGNSISPEGISKERRFLTRGGGAYLEGTLFSNWFELFSFVPVGAMYFLFVPFPWQVHNTLAMFALLQNLLLWYPVAILSVVGFRSLVVKRPFAVLALVGFAGSAVAAYGVVEGNMGPAMRHRSQFQIVFVVFAGVALSNRVRFLPSAPDTSSVLSSDGD